MRHHHLAEPIIGQNLDVRFWSIIQRQNGDAYLFICTENTFLEEIEYPLNHSIATGSTHVGENNFANQQGRLGFIDFHWLKKCIQGHRITHIDTDQRISFIGHR